MTLEIKLNFKRVHFEEIYFGDHQGSYFKGPIIQNTFRNMLLSLFITGIFFFIPIYISNHKSGGLLVDLIGNKSMAIGILLSLLFIVSQFASIILTIVYFHKVSTIRKWRKQVKELLDTQEKFRESKLVLSEKGFSLVQDENVTAENWSNFSKGEVNSSYISLFSEINYIIPSKSMTSSEFQRLSEFVSKKLVAA